MRPAALLRLLCVLTFPLYFKQVNARFRPGTATPADLVTWGQTHTLRTLMACGAPANAASG